MQLLEQLAMGRCTNSTLESITTEYASICGYVECMSELCESEVLFEGISVKDIVKTVCDVIISLFGKIKKLGMKVISFLKSKISWFTARGKNHSNNKFEEDLKNEETKSEKIKDYIGYVPSEVRYYDDVKVKDIIKYAQSFYPKSNKEYVSLSE